MKLVVAAIRGSCRHFRLVALDRRHAARIMSPLPKTAVVGVNARRPIRAGAPPEARYDMRPRAVSSVGRASARQAEGHWFEPSTAHFHPRQHHDFLVGWTGHPEHRFRRAVSALNR